MIKEKNIDHIELMETTQASHDYSKWETPMGESKKDALRVNFNKKLKLEFHGVKVTSDAGLLVYREIDDVFGLTDTVCTKAGIGRKVRHNKCIFV